MKRISIRMMLPVLVMICLLLSAGKAQAGQGAALDTIDLALDSGKKSTLIRVELVSVDGPTWTYRVTEISGQDLSHWVLGAGVCTERIVSYAPTAGAELGKDGNRDFYGIKWNTPGGFKQGEFSFTLDAVYPAGQAQVLVKAGNPYTTGPITGPDCTQRPTAEPTPEPTAKPTEQPTEEPTVGPTEEPTQEPTAEPTVEPTQEPTAEPTQEPTAEPTEEPTQEPTAEPTVEPTAEPTQEPTAEPTQAPTVEPTEEPTEEPTVEPTQEPTEQPTQEPTAEPTQAPVETPAPTETPAPPAGSSSAAIGDRVWLDKNANGVQDAGEQEGVANVAVRLYTAEGLFAGETWTGSDGNYRFAGLAAGRYFLVFTAPTGYIVSPQNVGQDALADSDANPANGQTAVTDLADGESDLSWDMGLSRTTTSLEPGVEPGETVQLFMPAIGR